MQRTSPSQTTPTPTTTSNKCQHPSHPPNHNSEFITNGVDLITSTNKFNMSTPNANVNKTPTCAACGKQENTNTKLMACAQCKSIKYCTKLCQRNDWPSHKTTCNKRFMAHVSSTRPVHGNDGYGSIEIYGPLRANEVDSFLVRHQLTRFTTGVHPLTLGNFPFTPGMLYDTGTTGGFGGMLVLTDKNGIYSGDGWNQPTLTFENALQNGALNVHAWCVDTNGTVHDYDNEVHINCFFRTDNEVRVACDEETTLALMPYLHTIFNAWLEQSNKTVQQHINDINNNRFNKRHCWHRAMLLNRFDPDKYTVVIGSFGFVQRDGINTFYVWG